jgi:hypothetical protein
MMTYALHTVAYKKNQYGSLQIRFNAYDNSLKLKGLA